MKTDRNINRQNSTSSKETKASNNKAASKEAIKGVVNYPLPKTVLYLIGAIFILYFAVFHSLFLEKAQNTIITRSESYSQRHYDYLAPAKQYFSLNSEISSNISLLDHPSYITSDRSEVDTTDPRTIAMYNFLQDYSSPMVYSAEAFIEEADKYGLDWRLVASISGVESAFGRITPKNSFNAWGWKGDPTKEWSEFGTWENGIATVTKGLALGYGINKTPYQIESTYCPPCGANPAHAWANGVQSYMNSLNIYLSEVTE